jgi:N-acetylneuraminic acid mutarotase
MFGGYGKDAQGKTGALNDLWSFDPVTEQWIWVSGDSLVEQFSQYGLRGVPSKDNKPGGRYGSASGTGADGQFYLYGGYGSHASSSRGGYLNDVWRFNPKEKTWTWISGDTLINQREVWGTRGVPAPANKPGGRYEMAGFVDGKNFYVFGGKGGGRGPDCYACLFNDIWKYDIDANQWAWLGGDNNLNRQGSYGGKGEEQPENEPGARSGAVLSVYDGRIYVFGGVGLKEDSDEDKVRFNDLWRFNPSSGQWAWISGDRNGDERGLYGPRGVSNPASQPGARDGANAGFDQSGNFYLFGGTGFDKNGKLSQLNDLWTYGLSSGKWTWLSGDEQIRALGSYGTQGVPSQTNTPGARCYAAHWFNRNDKLWLFGGILHGYEGSVGAQFSDLWVYNPNTKEWTWVSGEKKVDDAGSYTQNNAIGSMVLGGRSNGAQWTDKSGNLWFFGGSGTSPEGNPAETSRYGDLWKYDIASTSWSFVKGDTVPHTFGFGAKGQASVENRPRGRDRAVSWVDNEGDLWLFGGKGLFINPAQVNESNLGQLNDLWEYNIRSNQWVWIGGDTTGNNKGIYGTPGTASRFYMPGSRMGSVGWTDPQGNFWLFGGLGYDANGNKEGLLSDLWKFNPGTKEWTWVSGNKVLDQPSVYGERGVPAGSSHPGSRHNARYGCWG